MAALLEVEDVTKAFGGVRALGGVSLAIDDRGLRCIIGPNGCGKTTLFNVITGAFRPTSGTVRFAGRDITGLRPHQISRLGIARKFQVPGIYPSLSVAENLEVPLVAARRSAQPARSAPRCRPAQRWSGTARALSPRGARGRAGRRPRARPKTMARDRHAARGRGAASPARRADRGHDRRRDCEDRRSDPRDPCGHRSRGLDHRARHELRGAPRLPGRGHDARRRGVRGQLSRNPARPGVRAAYLGQAGAC